METVKKLPTSIRFREDVLGRLKIEASRQHRSVSNYLEMLLMQWFHMDEPNEETKAAIEEARSRKDYSSSKLYSSAVELFADLDKEE